MTLLPEELRELCSLNHEEWDASLREAGVFSRTAPDGREELMRPWPRLSAEAQARDLDLTGKVLANLRRLGYVVVPCASIDRARAALQEIDP